jgi:hypothetical protein
LGSMLRNSVVNREFQMSTCAIQQEASLLEREIRELQTSAVVGRGLLMRGVILAMEAFQFALAIKYMSVLHQKDE